MTQLNRLQRLAALSALREWSFFMKIIFTSSALAGVIDHARFTHGYAARAAALGESWPSNIHLFIKYTSIYYKMYLLFI
jgi:hypothetical protein